MLLLQMMIMVSYLFICLVCLSAGHTVINGDQIYPAVQPYANFGQSRFRDRYAIASLFLGYINLLECKR